jgi:hypothetical protein
MAYTIKGIIGAERACECCGNKNLERNVVLADDHGELLYVGADCAGQLLHGRKSAKNTKSVKTEAEFLQRCRELLTKHTPHEVALYVERSSCNGQVIHDRLTALGFAAF